MLRQQAMRACALAVSLVLAACGARDDGPVRPPPLVLDDTSPIGRLDERAIPVAYDVTFAIDPAAAGFTGEVAIELDVRRPLRTIWLHAKDLELDRVTVTAGGRSSPARVVADQRRAHTEGQGGLVGLTADRVLAPGRVTVTLAYRGRYRAREGMIRVGGGEPLVYTDSEPEDARTFLPCFDDPRFKTPWRVSVIAPRALGVFANYPEERRTLVDDARVRVTFARTRPLPTYLVAVAVGALEAVPVAGTSVPVRVLVAGAARVPATQVLQDAVPGLLAELVTVLDEPMPFPKLDLLIVPMEEGRGGMENPGLFTLASHMVLAEPTLVGDATRAKLEDTVHVLAHELAHLWLGDLITLGDWGELWLQEGAATWLGIRTARTVLGDDWLAPFHRDQLDAQLATGTRPPIRAPITAPGDANALFRVETYAGGAAVFDALAAWLGARALTGALADLVDRHRDGTVRAADFLAAVRARAPQGVDTAALDEVVAAMLDATRLPTVAATQHCNPWRLELAVDSPAPQLVCVDREGGPRACTIVRGGRGELPIDDPRACPRWFLLDPGGGAPYLRAWTPRALANLLSYGAVRGRDATALVLELERRTMQGRLGALSIGDQLAAATWVATRATSHVARLRAIEHLDLLQRATANVHARRALVRVVQHHAAAHPPGFTASTSALALWLARHDDRAAGKAARVAVPDLVAAVAGASDREITDAMRARAAVDGLRYFRKLRALALRDPPRSSPILRVLASSQFDRVSDQLGYLLVDKRLPAEQAEVLLLEASHNPRVRPALLDLVRMRRDLSASARVQLALALCDVTHADEVTRGLDERLRVHVRERVGACASLRWDVKDLPIEAY